MHIGIKGHIVNPGEIQSSSHTPTQQVKQQLRNAKSRKAAQAHKKLAQEEEAKKKEAASKGTTPDP